MRECCTSIFCRCSWDVAVGEVDGYAGRVPSISLPDTFAISAADDGTHRAPQSGSTGSGSFAASQHYDTHLLHS